MPFSNYDYDRLVQNTVEPMECNDLRTICIAYRDFSSDDLPNWDDEAYVVDQLTCICICGIEDPVRPEIPDAITQCRNAGITIRMITGDSINLARSIVLKCGIISANDDCLALEGKELHQCIRTRPDGKVEQNLFDKIWPNLRVLARNALTKEASDIILLDDNFNTIVKAVMWGGQVYDSIARTSQFILTINFATILCIFIGACLIKEVPLRIAQIFWINSIIATLASLALASKVSAEDLLTCKPYGWIRPLITRSAMKNIIGHVFYQLAV
ncbi:unnamed protein product [Rotaria sp. Silwood2]|nr:unnamed protein product [Rotaria sp. Silwood2]CAF4496383.1 unnamed protein product [Rotaria sp. Silwood2]